MADETLQVQIQTLAKLDAIKDAISGLKSVQKEGALAQKSLSGAFSGFQKSLSGIPGQLASIAAGAVSLRAIGGFLSESVSEALEAEKTLNRLTVALEATGEASRQNIEGFQQFSEALQGASRFGDDLILEQIALAKNFGLSNDAAKSLVQSSADLAAVTGKDLTTSTETFIKALSGQLPRELKLLGKEFANLTEEQLKAGKAQELFNSKFGGRAAADVTTLTGSIEQLKNSFKNLQEAAGVGILGGTDAATNVSAVTLVIENLKDGIDLLFKEETKIESLTNKLETLQKAINFNSKDDTTKSTLANLESQRDRVLAELASIQKQAQQQSQSAAPVEVVKVAPIDEGEVKRFLDQIKNVGRSSVEIAKQERDERLKILKQAFGGEDSIGKLSVDNRKLYADAKFRIEKDLQDKITSEQKKASKEQEDSLNKRLQNFKNASQNLGNSFTEIFKSIRAGDRPSSDLVAGAALGTGQAITQGAAGGRALLGAGAQLGGAAIGGPLGEEIGSAVGPILQELSKGKEAAKAFVTEFLNSIPDMILGLVEGIGAAAEAFLDNIPIIIERIVADVPKIIDSLAASMPRVALAFAVEMPLAAVTFASSLIEQAPRIAESIIKSIGNAPGKAVGGIGKVFKFADGGQVPAGFGNGSSERFPALLGSGELVVNSSLTSRLKAFLDAQGGDTISGNDNRSSGSQSMMESVMAALSAPVIVNLDGREIARAVRRQKMTGLMV